MSAPDEADPDGDGGTRRCDVILHRLPPSREPGVKLIRLATGLDLKAAVEVLTYVGAHLPCCLLAGVSDRKARALQAEVAALGGSAAIRESQSSHPMALWPDADALFEWRQWYGLTRK